MKRDFINERMIVSLHLSPIEPENRIIYLDEIKFLWITFREWGYYLQLIFNKRFLWKNLPSNYFIKDWEVYKKYEITWRLADQGSFYMDYESDEEANEFLNKLNVNNINLIELT